MSGSIVLAPSDVLLAVDLQNDFCTGGALAVPGGEETVPVVNRLAERFDKLVLTQDWHPAGHLSFASSHPGTRPLDRISVSYGEQVLWPDHCVQGSPGAEFHPALQTAKAQLILRKGFHPAIDSYSAFVENDRTTSTGLCGYLRERGITRIFLAGMAFDFCVLWSAEDAHRLGFRPVVIEDACRGIDASGSMAAARAALQRLGVPCIHSEDLKVAP